MVTVYKRSIPVVNPVIYYTLEQIAIFHRISEFTAGNFYNLVIINHPILFLVVSLMPWPTPQPRRGSSWLQKSAYGVATRSRRLKIIGLFCRI